jgi:signal transduction histidine kinase
VALSVPSEHALLRIAQEALANAVRHAGATEVTLSLDCLDDDIALAIADNGQGFDLEDARLAHGLGLTLMRERARELGGTFALQTNPGQGTIVLVTIPAGVQA